MIESQFLGPRALKALLRFGDIMCPKNNDFPSYSECGCIEHVDKMIAFVPPSDLKDLNMALSALSFMPDAVLKWLLNKTGNSHTSKGGLSSTFRQLDFGLKGIIFGTYYSGMVGKNYKGVKPTDVIEFQLNRMA